MGSKAKLKICIDREECIGDAICVNEAPETFDLDDDQKAVVLASDGDEREYIVEAAKSCPLDIITLTDAETGEQIYPES